VSRGIPALVAIGRPPRTPEGAGQAGACRGDTQCSEFNDDRQRMEIEPGLDDHRYLL